MLDQPSSRIHRKSAVARRAAAPDTLEGVALIPEPAFSASGFPHPPIQMSSNPYGIYPTPRGPPDDRRAERFLPSILPDNVSMFFLTAAVPVMDTLMQQFQSSKDQLGKLNRRGGSL
jgi:hypothetical protein